MRSICAKNENDGIMKKSVQSRSNTASQHALGEYMKFQYHSKVIGPLVARGMSDKVDKVEQYLWKRLLELREKKSENKKRSPDRGLEPLTLGWQNDLKVPRSTD